MWWLVQSENYCKHCRRHVTFLVTTSKIFLVPYWHFLWTECPIHEIFTLKNSKGSSWCQLGDVSGSVLSDHCFTQTMNMPCNSKSMSHWGLKIWCCPRQSDERWLIDRMASDFWIFISAVNLERNLNYSCHSGFSWPFSKPPGALGDEKCCMTHKKPRCDDLNSLTEVSFGRWCFYTGDKHVQDETVVARSSVCVCARLCWPLLTQRSLSDVPLQGHFDAKLWQVHISATFCINSPARIWVTTARREYQCQACQAK